MLKGSSICTPISSMASSRKARTPVAGIMARPHDFQRVKGMAVNQMIRNLDVCLCTTPLIFSTGPAAQKHAFLPVDIHLGA